MLTLNDGRSELWQWDTGRTLDVDADCSQVHFSNKVFGRSIDVDVIDGVANIPDILLQTDKDLTAWAFVGTAENGYTKISRVFKVNKRNKPSDYVFTPTDQTTLEDILDRIEVLEKRPSGGNGGIAEEVDPTVPDWAKQPQKPTYTAAEVGALPETTKIPSTAEDVGALPANALIPEVAADVGAIPAPATAQVGQTIVVREVDADGKPVSWECADLAGGDKWELIADNTLETETDDVLITFVDRPQKKLRIVHDTLAAETDVNYSNVKVWTYSNGDGYFFNFYPTAVPKTVAKRSIHIIELIDDDSVLVTTSTESVGETNGYTERLMAANTASMYLTPKDYSGRNIKPQLTAVNIHTRGVFAAGTRLRIWGVAK